VSQIENVSDPVSRARALTDLVRECADEAERERRLPQRLAQAMAEAGLYRIAAPKSVGGAECDPATQIETIEVISAADGAAGWNLMIGIENMGFLGAGLSAESAQKLFADPDLIVAGALNPLGRATPVAGGFRVSGQWPFASGCHNAHYFWGQCVVFEGDAPAKSASGGLVLREALVPASEFEILDTWHVSGLRGSGSHDVRIDEVFVPEPHMTSMAGMRLRETGTLFRIPPITRLAYNKVGVATGIARAAIDHFVALASEKQPRGSGRLLRERYAAQMAMADAETELRSARAFVLEAVGDIWNSTEAGDTITPEQEALARLACSSAAAASVRAVDIVHAAAGTSANFVTSPLERCVRDVRVVPQHIMVSPQWRLNAGRILLGSESLDPTF
jgi:alkylation response protein AidB-like acyl-CoA dehydrogenase